MMMKHVSISHDTSDHLCEHGMNDEYSQSWLVPQIDAL